MLEVADVIKVNSLKGRYHGSSIFLDVTIAVDAKLSLKEAHDICDRVESHLHGKEFHLFMSILNHITNRF